MFPWTGEEMTRGEVRGARNIMILWMLLALAVPISLIGQTTGRIEGYVRDADTHQPVAGVEVVVEGTRLGNVTNGDGYYFIPRVPVGLQNITARLIGYGTVTVRKQRIYADQIHPVDIAIPSMILELPNQIVEGDRPPLLIKDHLVSKARTTSETITAYPVDSYRDIVTLQAGAVRYGDALDPEYRVSVRGGRTSQNIVYIDGIDVRRYQTHQNLLDVPEFGIEEIDVVTGGPGPGYGGGQSGAIHVVTRDGSQDLSGRLRFETEEINPSSINFGYNRIQFSLGGPVPMVDDLAYFASVDLIGKGDRRPKGGGFRGTTDDLFDVAERYSKNEEVSAFLGRELDIMEMLESARSRNPGLPILNLTDLRQERFGGTDYKGRLPGNRGDEYRFQGKLAYRLTDRVRLTGTYLEDRDQGILYDHRRIFWTEERNPGFVNRQRLGIIGYDHTLGQTPQRSYHLSVRGSYQRFENHTGDLYTPSDANVSELGLTPDASLGYHDQTAFGNFMFRDIPIFGEDFWPTTYEQVLHFDVDESFAFFGNNPFGIEREFWDQNRGLNDIVLNSREDRADFRIDFDGQFGRRHRLRSGFEVKAWQLNNFSGAPSRTYMADFWYVKPEMESFYFEERIEHQPMVANLGVRLDSFFAGTDYSSIPAEQHANRIRPTRKTALSPRFSVAYPVTDRVQARGGYRIDYQLPAFSQLYDAINVDWHLQGESVPFFFGDPDLDFEKTASFELGFTALLSNDWVFDLAGYKTTFERGLAARYFWEDYRGRYLRIYTNDDSGVAKGLDLSLKKRLSDYFSADLAYSLLVSEGSGSDADDFVSNEGRFLVGNEPPPPPEEFSPNDYDQTHTIDALFHLRFPDDFKVGTIAGTILKDTGYFVTFQAHSGRPYPRQDRVELVFLEENNIGRTEWYSMLNLRVTKDFRLGGLDYTAFADIRNLLGTENLSARQVDPFGNSGVTNGVYNTTGSPFTDGLTVSDALDYLGIGSPEDYVDPSQREPSDIDGDGDRDEADRAEFIRRLDMNGDGQVTLEEELAMAILAHGAFDANPEHFDIPRLVRFGLEIRF
jgi:hypothetical protein